jgi:hypothetical protein
VNCATTRHLTFDIHLADGQKLPVVTPDHLFIFPDASEFLVVLPDNAFRIVDSLRVVSAGRGAAQTKKAAIQ